MNSAAFVAGASATTGATRGVVLANSAVDVPLEGPGAWLLSASTPVASTLACPQANTTFASEVVIDSAQTCQLEISSTGATTTWRLVPVP